MVEASPLVNCAAGRETEWTDGVGPLHVTHRETCGGQPGSEPRVLPWGEKLADHGTGDPDHGTGDPDHGTGDPDHGTGDPDHGTGDPDHGTGDPDHGTGGPRNDGTGRWPARVVS